MIGIFTFIGRHKYVFAGILSGLILIGVFGKCTKGCHFEEPEFICVQEECHTDLMPFPQADGTITLMPMTSCTCIATGRNPKYVPPEPSSSGENPKPQ